MSEKMKCEKELEELHEGDFTIDEELQEDGFITDRELPCTYTHRGD